MMRPFLRDRSFELDCDDSHKCVSFANGVFDRDSSIFESDSPMYEQCTEPVGFLEPMGARSVIASALQMADDDGLIFTSATTQLLRTATCQF